MAGRAPRGGGRCTSAGYSPLLRYRLWRLSEPIEWLDNLIHHPRMGWIPRPLTSWICDLMDWKLGLSGSEIRRVRYGNLPGYSNQLDWTVATNATTTAGSNAVVHYKTGGQT